MADEPNPNVSNKSDLTEAASTYQRRTGPASRKKRILVVDDDAMIRSFLDDALSMRDYDVTTASGGDEGFKQFGQKVFDLVITDCRMPGTDGWHLAALIKQVSADTPIIMITGQSEDEVRPKMQASDIDFLIFKPFKLDKLYETIRASFELIKG